MKNFYKREPKYQEEILFLLLLRLLRNRYGGKKGDFLETITLEKSDIVGVDGYFTYAIFKKGESKKSFLCWVSEEIGNKLKGYESYEGR